MSTDIDSSWDRIAAWLRAYAPTTARVVNPPASEPALDAVERELGTPLPADVRAWYRRADGMSASPHAGHVGSLLPPHLSVYSLADAMRSRQIWLDVCRGLDPEEDADENPYVAGNASQVWLASWLPVATTHGGTDLFVDLRDGTASGCVMAYDKVGACQPPPAWPTITAMLGTVADALERNGVAAGCRPEVDAQGRLNWRMPEGLWVDGFPLYGGAEFTRPFTQFATYARADGIRDPDAATLLAARAGRLVDALLSTAETLAAGHDTRFDDPDPRDELALRRYAETYGGLPGITEHLLAAGEGLGALVEPYAQRPHTRRIPDRPPFLPATVRERGDIVIDGTVSWPGLVAGLGWYIDRAGRDLAALCPRRA